MCFLSSVMARLSGCMRTHWTGPCLAKPLKNQKKASSTRKQRSGCAKRSNNTAKNRNANRNKNPQRLETQEEQPSSGVTPCCNPPQKTYPLLSHHSYTIRNTYPGPLETYDGEARGEKRLICFADLSESYLDLLFNQVEEEERKDKEKEKLEKQQKSCESKGQPTAKRCRENSRERSPQRNVRFCGEKKKSCGEKQKEGCAEKTKKNCAEVKKEGCAENCEEQKTEHRNFRAMIQQETKAQRLYEKGLLKKGCQNGKAWQCLLPREKLTYYWRVRTGEQLRPTAYSSFKQGFVKRFRKMHPRAGSKRVRAETRTQWYALERSQREPFVMQALVYHVSTGELDPVDQCAVREMYTKLKGSD
ncbi:uncharacterized protein LOC117582968 isoform X2 [Drosophila guanche]|uniref:uncharacterized protein LOC117582968 isoform X2 n=1 Tax=Drosophila guanche TaxID=7266 RepID=UPI0014709DFC|nr:uncharacterized protein LOC117582968 isoform X2 [Drosophila guanche]